MLIYDMLFILISIIVPLVIVFVLPSLLKRHKARETQARWILYIACVLFFISWYIPSPLIDGRDTSFMTHLIGGGVFSGLIWIYIKTVRAIKIRPLYEAAVMFAVVSSLGVINELAELAFVRFHLAAMPLDDTNWDLVANTLGTMIVFGVVQASRIVNEGR